MWELNNDNAYKLADICLFDSNWRMCHCCFWHTDYSLFVNLWHGAIVEDIGTIVCLAMQRYKQFHGGRPPKRLMLGRKEYAEFQLLNIDHESLGLNVTMEDCESMLVAI